MTKLSNVARVAQLETELNIATAARDELEKADEGHRRSFSRVLGFVEHKYGSEQVNVKGWATLIAAVKEREASARAASERQAAVLDSVEEENRWLRDLVSTALVGTKVGATAKGGIHDNGHREYKRLSQMTAEEISCLSYKEIELLARADAHRP